MFKAFESSLHVQSEAMATVLLRRGIDRCKISACDSISTC